MKKHQSTGIFAKEAREESRGVATRAVIRDPRKKAPQPCAYNCGRSVYTIYAVAMCNICRRKRGIPVWNE